MKERLENIQALRGVAALMVLFAHIKEAEGDYGGAGALLPHSIYLGVVGVDLFFLISGFVMTHVALAGSRGASAAQRFAYNRAARIYPAYWAATLLLMVLYAGKFYFFGEETPFPNPVATFLLTPSDYHPLVPVGWTLVHEMYFYVVFALFIFWGAARLPAFLGVWGAIIIAALALGAYSANALTKIVFNPLTFEFMTGAVIALVFRRGITQFAMPALVAGALIFAAQMLFFADALYPEVMGRFALRAALFTPPFALILYGAAALERTKSAIAPKWLRATGDASYSLYLIHVPTILVVGKLISISVPDGPFDNPLLLAAFLISALAAGFALHRIVETPLLAATRKLGDRLLATRTQQALAQDKTW